MTAKIFQTQDEAAQAGEAFCLADMNQYRTASTDTAARYNAAGETIGYVAVIKLQNEDFDRILTDNGEAIG